jgi:hypothetical protein
MSKNLTRKGLALGAVVALSTTLFAGAPAQAAGEVIFVPNTGTSYNTFTTADFALNASLAPGQVAGNIAQLAYQIAGDAAGSFEYTIGTSVAAATTATTATTQVVRPGSAPAVGAVNILNIGLKAADQVEATATKSVTVTAFLDSDNDSTLDAGEFQQARTVTFKKLSEVAVTVALTTPTVGDTTVTATAVLADINAEQTAAGTKVAFTATGSTPTAAPGVAAGSTAGTYSDTVTALVATNVVTARAYYGSVALGTAAVSATVAARSIIQPTAAVVAGANGVAAGNVARTNSAFSVAATIKDTATTAAVKSGVAVSAVVSSFGTLSATRTLSINGTVYTANSAVPASVALTSDAAGLATVNLVTVGFAASDAPVVTFSAQNFSVAVTVDLQDAAYTLVSTAVGSALRTIDEGGSVTLNYAVKDQFGVAIGSGARLEVVTGYSTPVTSYVAVTNGAASVTVTDTTASTDADITVATTLQTQSLVTGNWTSESVTGATQTVYVASGAVAFDFVPAAVSTNLSTNGTITASVNRAGAPVTIAAKGVIFTVNSVEYTDTVTLFSGANGDVSVSAKSNLTGEKTVTWTAGTEVKTAVLTIGAAASNAGKSIDLSSVPKYSLPGSTLVITGYVKDTYGNGIPAAATSPSTFSVTYTGPGFVVGGTLPTTTDSNGKFTFTVILGAADAGSAVVTVKYDADGATTTIAELSSTATVTLGSAPAAAATAAVSGSTGKFFVSATAAAGKSVVVKVAGKFFASFKATGAKKSVALKAPKGSHKVTVFVSGKLVATKTVTVK